jgi:hypothetical protein
VIVCVTVHVQVDQCYVSGTVLIFSSGLFDLHKGERKAWQYPWKIYSVFYSLFYTIDDKSNVTNKIRIRIMNPYKICDARY